MQHMPIPLTTQWAAAGGGRPLSRQFYRHGLHLLHCMEQHLLHLYQHGIITKESAITYTNEASLIERLG